MRETRHYEVAGHRLSVTAGTEHFALMGNYEPFAVSAAAEPIALAIEDGAGVVYTEELRQEDEGQEIICGHTVDGQPVFEFRWEGETAGWLVCSGDYREGRLIVSGHCRKLAIDNALMVIYALATAERGTALFHAAAVSCGGRAYLFLGRSGTGKSTHARLWLKHVEGAELVNDDNPVVKLQTPPLTPPLLASLSVASVPEGRAEGRGTATALVCGSPWSGKTPCYRNVQYPLGGIVLLSQAPYNSIRRLTGIEAYAALVPAISGKRWDKGIADGLHQTENRLAMSVPVWHLECLPDEAAARLCKETIAI